MEVETTALVTAGDTLVIGMRDRTSEQERTDTVVFLQDQLPGVRVVIVENVAAMVIYQDEQQADSDAPGD